MLLLGHPLLKLEGVVSRTNNLSTVIILHAIKAVIWSKELNLVQLNLSLQLFNQL